MLHSISSKSLVLPYGKYKGRPAPLPPDPADAESVTPQDRSPSGAVHGFNKNRRIPRERRTLEPQKRPLSQVENLVFLENGALGGLKFEKKCFQELFFNVFVGGLFWSVF